MKLGDDEREDGVEDGLTLKERDIDGRTLGTLDGCLLGILESTKDGLKLGDKEGDDGPTLGTIDDI